LEGTLAGGGGGATAAMANYYCRVSQQQRVFDTKTMKECLEESFPAEDGGGQQRQGKSAAANESISRGDGDSVRQSRLLVGESYAGVGKLRLDSLNNVSVS
jgi:hypothetical protein